MSSLNRALIVAVVVGFAMSPSLGHAQATVCSPAHKKAWPTPPQVVVLLPQVHLWKDNGFSVRESEGATEAVETGFLTVLAQTFADKGYKLFLDPLAMKEWEETPPNDQAIKPLKGRFNSLFPPIEGSQDCKLVLDTSLKGDLEKLKDHDEFDVVVLSNASGTAFTKMGKVFDAVNIYGDPHSLSFNIAVADRSTGELVYYCNSGANGDYLGSPETRLSGPIEKCLGKYFNVRSKHRR